MQIDINNKIKEGHNKKDTFSKYLKTLLSNMKYRERVTTLVIMTLRSRNYVKLVTTVAKPVLALAHPDQFSAARSRHRPGHFHCDTTTGALASNNPFIIFIFCVRTLRVHG